MYTRSITRAHRTAFVIAIDQSGSMAGMVTLMGRTISKSQAVAEATDRLLFELIERARRSDGVRDYYDVAVVGYSGEGVRSLIGGERGFVPITELAGRSVVQQRLTFPLRRPDGLPVLCTSILPAYVEPCATGATPMYEALLAVREMLAGWCADPAHADSFPPIVFNITDGEPSDCGERDLYDICTQLMRTGTRDGRSFLLNMHIASDDAAESILFPAAGEIDRCNNRYARMLFDCSSVMPEAMNEEIRDLRGTTAPPPYRGMSYNASMAELLTMLDIGSVSVPIQ